MSQDEFTEKDERPGGGLNFERFEEMIDDLKHAIAKFRDDQTPESFAGIITSLQSLRVSGADVWNQIAGYIKRHPVQSALVAGLAFFALRGMTSGRPLLPERSDNAENAPVH